MKIRISNNLNIKNVFTILFLFISINVSSQEEYKGIKVIRANKIMAGYRIDNEMNVGVWRIATEIDVDSLFVYCFNKNHEFVFYTDLDSISFKLTAGYQEKFYVLLNDNKYALTLIKGIKPNFKALYFDNENINSKINYWYPGCSGEYLTKLRQTYKIDSIINGAINDEERVLNIIHWVHNQWEHNGNNIPKKYDAISILEEAQLGKKFRCAEYGIVASACLNSVGLKARTIGLKTKDVETRKSGAGHVATEVFLNDLQKWVFIDVQWDIIPYLNNIPLNAVELQKAISENFQDLEYKSYSSVSKMNYSSWIYQYLFYFDTVFDNSGANRKVDNKRRVMLVPIGAKEPKQFQWWWMKITSTLYTYSLLDFYQKPDCIIEH